MATLLENAILSEKVYHGENEPAPPSAFKLVATSEEYIQKLIDLNGNVSWDKDFYAETYINESTGEMIVTIRGTAGFGDVLPEWPQVALGGITPQDDPATSYLSAMSELAISQGYDLSCTGHSLADSQCQTAIVRGTEKGNIISGGVGFNGPASAYGAGDPDTDYNYLQLDTRGDIVNKVGGEEISGTEITLASGPGLVEYAAQAAVGGVLLGIPGVVASVGENITEAHSMTALRMYLEAHPNIGSMTVAQANALSAEQISQIRYDPDAFEYHDDPLDQRDLEGDGFGVYNGNNFDEADFDSILIGDDVNGLQWRQPEDDSDIYSDEDYAANTYFTGERINVANSGAIQSDISNGLQSWSNLTSIQLATLTSTSYRASQQGINLYNAIQNGNELQALGSGIGLLNSVDQALDVRDAGFIEAGSAASNNLSTASSAISLASAIDNGNWGGAVVNGYRLGDQLNAFDGSASATRGVSAIASAYNLYSSIQNGDEFGSVVSAYTLYNSLNSTPIPGGAYLGYVNAGLQLLDGDIESAAISAATTYVTTVATEAAMSSSIMQGAVSTANPYVIAAAAVVVAILAIANSGDEPDPEASLIFAEDADGNVIFSTDANKTGSALEQQLNGLGGVLAQHINDFENSLPTGVLPGDRVDINALPDIVSIQDQKSGETQLRLTGGRNMGGGVLIVVGGAEELVNIMPQVILNSNFQDRWITSVRTIVSENGQVFVDTQANPFGNSPSFSIAQGTGTFIGGGNVDGNRELVIATDEQIRNLAPRPIKAVEKEMAEVSKTWRIEKGVFDGPGGQLLAAGVATGLMSLNEVYAATTTEPQAEQAPRSLLDIEAYRNLQNEADSDLIVAGHGRLQNAASKAAVDIGPAEVYQGEFSPVFLRDSDGSYVDSNNRPPDTYSAASRISAYPEEASLFAGSNERSQQSQADEQADLIRELARPIRINDDVPAVVPAEETITPVSSATSNIVFETEAIQLDAGRADQLSVIEDREVYTTAEQLLVNDDKGVRFIGLSRAINGRVSMNAAGDILFIPTADFAGEAGFSYLIEDDAGLQQTIDVMVSVANVNDAPLANDDVVTTAVDSALDLQVLLDNDRDIDNEEMRLLAISQVNNGRVIIGSDGNYQFIPDTNFSGETQLTYVVEDAGGSRSVAAAIIIVSNDSKASVMAVNKVFDNASDQPAVEHFISISAANESGNIRNRDYRQAEFNLAEDESRLFTVPTLLGVQEDAAGESLQIINARMLDESQGEVLITPEGGVYFTPAENLTGEVSFEYDVSDGVTTSTTQTTLKIWPENDAPLVHDDQFISDEDTVLSLSGSALLANDSDIEGNTLRIVGIWGTSDGSSATYDAVADRLNFTPEKDLFGDAWVDFLVEDEGGAWAVERADIEIANVDDPAIALDDNVSLLEDQSRIITVAELTANDVNADREILRINSIDASTLTNGKAVLLASGDIRFTPQADYAGSQILSYELIDESNNVSSARITLDILQVNDAPLIQLSTGRAQEDELATFNFVDLLSNARDLEDDMMQVVGARSKFGSVSYDEVNGQISFQASADFNSYLYGAPAVVEYLVADEHGASTWGTINIDVAAVNDVPLAGSDTLFAWARGPAGYINQLNSIDLLANDTDVDGETFWVDQVGQGAAGTTSFNQSSGVISYVADAGFVGTDRFTYRVADGVPNSFGLGAVRVEVLANTAPVATDFAATAVEDNILHFDWVDFLPNVSDQDLLQQELPEQLRLLSVSNAVNGSVSMNPDGSVSFSPLDNFNSAQNLAVASFDYVVSDIVGNTTQATVSINYKPVNDDPVANPDGLPSIDEDSAGLVFSAAQLTLNDTDVDIDAAGVRDIDNILVQIGSAAHGSVTSLGNGQFRYTPNENFNGMDRFSYTVSDGKGGADSSYAEINVRSVNDSPVAEFVRGSGNDLNTNRLAGVLDHAFDIDGDSLSLNVTGFSGGVSSAYASDGDIIWRGASQGGGTIYYNVLDGKGGVASSQANVSISHVNSTPVVAELRTTYYERADVETRYNSGVAESRFHVEVHGFMRATDSDGYISTYLRGQNNPDGFRVSTDGNWSIELGWSYWFQNSFNQTFNYSIAAYDNELASVTRSFSVTVRVNPGDNSATVLAPPLLFDLNANGFELASYKVDSEARFDVDGDGKKELTSWMAGGDGLLAIDINNDGVISQSNEISFIEYVEGAKTDLEGLRFFDSDKNGELSANDAKWNQFGIWIDGNGDGSNDEGEWQKLDDIGIASISLTSDGIKEELGNGNELYGTGQFTWEDGTTGEFADLGLSYQDQEPEIEVIIEELPAEELSRSEIELSDDAALLTDADDVLEDEPDQLDSVLPESDENEEALAEETAIDSSSLPSDDELDRMAQQDVVAIVSQPPVESVTPAPEHAGQIPVPVATSFDTEDEQHLAA